MADDDLRDLIDAGADYLSVDLACRRADRMLPRDTPPSPRSADAGAGTNTSA